MTVADLLGLRGRRPGFLVPVLAVNDGREALFGVALHVLPDVQHRAARRVDERAPAGDEGLEQFHGDAEGRQDHDVARRQRVERFARVGEEAHTLGANLIVDVRVVNDLAGEIHALIGESLARLIRVVDGAIDAVAEAELPREVHGEAAGLEREVGGFDLGDEIAVIAGGKHAGDLVFAIEAAAKNQRWQAVYRTSQARGVSASSGASAAGPALPTASSICPSSSSSESDATTVRAAPASDARARRCASRDGRPGTGASDAR